MFAAYNLKQTNTTCAKADCYYVNYYNTYSIQLRNTTSLNSLSFTASIRHTTSKLIQTPANLHTSKISTTLSI